MKSYPDEGDELLVGVLVSPAERAEQRGGVRGGPVKSVGFSLVFHIDTNLILCWESVSIHFYPFVYFIISYNLILLLRSCSLLVLCVQVSTLLI